jgi:hypothetical protein
MFLQQSAVAAASTPEEAGDFASSTAGRIGRTTIAAAVGTYI